MAKDSDSDQLLRVVIALQRAAEALWNTASELEWSLRGQSRARRRDKPVLAISVAALIQALGGPVQLGRDLGIVPSAISNWASSNEVPRAWHARVLALALRDGVQWRPPGWPPQAQLRWKDKIETPPDEVF